MGEIEMALHVPHRNSGSSRYCGPTAIMAITSLPGSDIRAAINQARDFKTDAAGNQFRVTGVSNADLVAAMAVLGWNVVEEWSGPSRKIEHVKVDDPKGNWFDGKGGRFRFERRRPDSFQKPPRFADFLREHGARGPFIVNVTGHYIAVSHGELCDAVAAPVPLEIERYLTTGKRRSYRNSWVWKWWRFEQAA
jgi:hypothetical protein